ncbi:MAG: DUF624 domain-containing protein [Peptostreptococcaceae bacterium]
MSNDKSRKNNVLYDTLNYLYYLIGVNICFLFSNILFIIAIFTLKIEFQNTIFFILALIPAGPSITALFSVVGKLIREKDIRPFKDYIEAYKLNFIDSMKVWSIQLLILIIVILDIRYMLISENVILVTLFKPLLFISGIIISISIYLYAILSRFKLRMKDLIKVSVMYTFKKLPLSLISLFVLLGITFLSLVRVQILMPALPVIIVYILMLGQMSTLREIEDLIIAE